MLYSFPNFVAALLLQMWVALKLGWFPLFGMFSDNYDSLSTLGKVKDLFWHLTLPLICYTYAALAYDVRFINANLQEVIRQDYIRTAKAKGLSGATILVKHAFRNTLIPLITSLGLMLPSLVSGAVIIEQIFSWPGIGRMFFESITARDYPTLMGLLLMFSVMTVVGQLLADILYALVDPRVRLGDR
jgi:peptide/nickel transport system permease protein